MRAVPLISGFAVLAGAWLGPLPRLAEQSFSAHMAMHMAVVAVAAPLVALGAREARAFAPVGVVAPIPASIAELVVVWAWHAPALHHAARHETWALVLEQGSFLAAGLLLWSAALAGGRRSQFGAGVVALLFTSMHMTLLGALFSFAPRPLYAHHGTASGVSAIADQHLGGAIMLLAGGLSYLVGGLCLTAGLLKGWRVERPEASL
jgi:putative membrane protein